jgi:hypothetical protein
MELKTGIRVRGPKELKEIELMRSIALGWKPSLPKRGTDRLGGKLKATN